MTESEHGKPSRWSLAGWGFLYLAAAAAIQAATRVPLDFDTAYHVVVARLIGEHGLLTAFPWTPFSVLGDRYADKELLFHLFLVPFNGLHWVTAAKIVGTLAGTATLFAIYLVLLTERVRWAGLWPFVVLTASSVFVQRFATVRPHVLAIGIAFVALWGAARNRLLLLAAIGVVYPWAHVSWHLPVLLAILAEVARWAAGGRPGVRPTLAVVAGLIVGFLLHPNTANLAWINWIHLKEVLASNVWAQRRGVALATEFTPFTPEQALRYATPIVGIAVAGLVLAWRRRRESCVPLAFALGALGFGVLTVKSVRFMEWLTPFAVGSLALAMGSQARRWIAPALLAATVLWTVLLGLDPLRTFRLRREVFDPEMRAFLDRSIPAGAQVFTCEWDYTGELLLALPDRRFIVALDPALFYARSPELYDLWYRLPRQAPTESARIVRDQFRADFVLCTGRRWFRFYRAIADEPGADVLLDTPQWTLIDVRSVPTRAPR